MTCRFEAADGQGLTIRACGAAGFIRVVNHEICRAVSVMPCLARAKSSSSRNPWAPWPMTVQVVWTSVASRCRSCRSRSSPTGPVRVSPIPVPRRRSGSSSDPSSCSRSAGAPDHGRQPVDVVAAHRLERLAGEQDVGMLGVALPHGVQRVGQGALAVVGEGEMCGQVGAHDEPAMVCVGAGDTGDQVRGVLGRERTGT